MKLELSFWPGICVRHERDARASWGRGQQAIDAFGEIVVFDINGKSIIQLENNVELWVNSSPADFTQYLIRPRIQ